jgi:adenosylhomocysteine nucleosidase
MNPLVCFALKEEAAPFRKWAAARPGVEVLLVGIGRQNAERAIRHHLQAHTPAAVFTCGFAGGLNPELKGGDVVFASSEDPSATATRLLAAGARPGRFFCADRIAITVAEKKKLRAETGADAVEMESAAIHAVCRERAIPCHTVRVISDSADEDLPLDFNALSRPDKNLDFGKLALAIAKSPGKIGALMELRKRTIFAAARLGRVLEQVIGA